MATRSTIAVELADGTVKQVYCHWDGYLDHNGRILMNHYSDPAKAIELVSLGSISSLRQEIGEKHDFDARYSNDDLKNQWTMFYGRDRGEDNCEAHTFADFDLYVKQHQCEEYEYIMRNTGEWQVSSYGGPYVALADAIAAEMLEKEMELDGE